MEYTQDKNGIPEFDYGAKAKSAKVVHPKPMAERTKKRLSRVDLAEA